MYFQIFKCYKLEHATKDILNKHWIILEKSSKRQASFLKIIPSIEHYFLNREIY